MAGSQGMARFQTWAEQERLSQRDEGEAPGAARELLKQLAGEVTAERLAELGALAAVAERVSTQARERLAEAVGAAFAAEARALLERGERRGLARFALGAAVALDGTGLLRGSDPLAVAARAEARGHGGALSELVSDLLAEQEAAPAEPPADSAELTKALERLVSAVAAGAPSERLDALAADAAEATAEVAESRGAVAYVLVRQAFERGARLVADVAGLRRLARAFAPLLGEGFLAFHPLAALLRPAWTDSPRARPDAGPREQEREASFAERLLARLEDRSQFKLPDLIRKPAIAEAMLARVEARLTNLAKATSWADRAERFVSGMADRAFRFDRRFGLLDRLLGATGDPFDRLALGRFDLAAELAPLAALNLSNLVLPVTEVVSSDAGFGGFGGFGGGFGGMGGLGLGGLGSMGVPALGAFPAGMPGLGALGPAQLANLGGLGGLNLGQLPGGLAKLVRSGKLGPQVLKALLAGKNLRGLSGLLGGGFTGSGLRVGGLGGRGGRGLQLLLRAPGGLRHLALGLGGGRVPTGYAAGLQVPGAPRAGLLLPALGRGAFGVRGYAPSLRGMAGGLPGWALPAGIRGSFGAPSVRLGGRIDFGRLGSFGGGGALRGLGRSGLGASLGALALGSARVRLPATGFAGGGLRGLALPGLPARGAGLAGLPGGLRGGFSAPGLRLPGTFRGAGGLPFGLPARGGLFDFRLDGFGRPQLASFGSPGGLWRLNASSLGGGAFGGGRPRLDLAGLGRGASGLSLGLPRFAGGFGGAAFGGLGLGGLRLPGLQRASAFGQDMRLGGRLPLFPGAGLRWQAAPWTAGVGLGGGSLSRLALPSGWQALGGALPGARGRGGALFGGAGALPGLRLPGLRLSSTRLPAGFLTPYGAGLPAGFSTGFQGGFSGFGVGARDWRGPGVPAALMPALGNVRLQLGAALPRFDLGALPRLASSGAFGAPTNWRLPSFGAGLRGLALPQGAPGWLRGGAFPGLPGAGAGLRGFALPRGVPGWLHGGLPGLRGFALPQGAPGWARAGLPSAGAGLRGFALPRGLFGGSFGGRFGGLTGSSSALRGFALPQGVPGWLRSASFGGAPRLPGGPRGFAFPSAGPDWLRALGPLPTGRLGQALPRFTGAGTGGAGGFAWPAAFGLGSLRAFAPRGGFGLGGAGFRAPGFAPGAGGFRLPNFGAGFRLPSLGFGGAPSFGSAPSFGFGAGFRAPSFGLGGARFAFGGGGFRAPSFGAPGFGFGGAGFGMPSFGSGSFRAPSFGFGGANFGLPSFGGASFRAPSFGFGGASFGLPSFHGAGFRAPSFGLGGASFRMPSFGGAGFRAPSFGLGGANFGLPSFGGASFRAPSFGLGGASFRMPSFGFGGAGFSLGGFRAPGFALGAAGLRAPSLGNFPSFRLGGGAFGGSYGLPSFGGSSFRSAGSRAPDFAFDGAPSFGFGGAPSFGFGGAGFRAPSLGLPGFDARSTFGRSSLGAPAGALRAASFAPAAFGPGGLLAPAVGGAALGGSSAGFSGVPGLTGSLGGLSHFAWAGGAASGAGRPARSPFGSAGFRPTTPDLASDTVLGPLLGPSGLRLPGRAAAAAFGASLGLHRSPASGLLDPVALHGGLAGSPAALGALSSWADLAPSDWAFVRSGGRGAVPTSSRGAFGFSGPGAPGFAPSALANELGAWRLGRDGGLQAPRSSLLRRAPWLAAEAGWAGAGFAGFAPGLDAAFAGAAAPFASSAAPFAQANWGGAAFGPAGAHASLQLGDVPFTFAAGGPGAASVTSAGGFVPGFSGALPSEVAARRASLPPRGVAPGADLGRALMGQATALRGRSALALAGDGRLGELVRGGAAGGWQGLAAHDLTRPAVGLTAALRGAASPAPRALRSALDLASPFEAGPRIVPGLTADAFGGRMGRALAAADRREATRALRVGGRADGPARTLVEAPSWQRLADQQLWGARPVVSYGSQPARGGASLTRAQVGRLLGGAARGSAWPVAWSEDGSAGGVRLPAGGRAALGAVGAAASPAERREAQLVRLLGRLERSGEGTRAASGADAPALDLVAGGGPAGRPLAAGTRLSGSNGLAGWVGAGGLPLATAALGGPGRLGDRSSAFAAAVDGRAGVSARSLSGLEAGGATLPLPVGTSGAAAPTDAAASATPSRLGGGRSRGQIVRSSGGGSAPRLTTPPMTQIRVGGAASALPEAEEAAGAGAPGRGPARRAGGSGHAAERAQSRAAKALRKAVADVDIHGDSGEPAPSRDSGVESAHLSASPQDLSLLVNQLYAQIKRELMIERERRGGLY